MVRKNSRIAKKGKRGGGIDDYRRKNGPAKAA